MEEIRIDVRDVDDSYFRDVIAFIDRDRDSYHLLRESAERLGEFDVETGNFWLTDGQVEAKADEIEVDGTTTPVWSVGIGQLITRPSGGRQGR